MGMELALRVTARLEQGHELSYGHHSYCGMGLRCAAGVYVYGSVYEGDLPAEGEVRDWQQDYGREEQYFHRREEFVTWLAAQSDASLAGSHLAEEWLRSNQRVTMQRLRAFCGGC